MKFALVAIALITILTNGCRAIYTAKINLDTLPKHNGNYTLYSILAQAKMVHMTSPQGSVAETQALDRWCRISTRLALRATDIYETKFIFERAPDDEKCDAKKIALTHWRQLSAYEVAAITTLEEAQAAWANAPVNSEEERESLERWQEFSEDELQKATYFHEIEKAVNRAAPDTPSLFEKINELQRLKESVRHV
ncbi:MAG: hypothetical protein O2794_00470 [bacterium]|nr:hypothetical protein [bacterium]